jgi:soluble lytic murein transglycosylase-like protein
MKVSNLIKVWYVIVCVLILISSWWMIFDNDSLSPTKRLKQASLQPNSPVSLQTYYLIEKYSEEYSIPKYIAYNVAFLETTYQGPFDWNYNPFLVSSAGAVGPMQVMVKTAEYINKEETTKTELKNSLDLNISTSMKLLKKLHDKYKDWGLTCGYYNTGYPRVNDYASFCISNKDYTKNWNSY